jgi:glycosyltransferase-like protein
MSTASHPLRIGLLMHSLNPRGGVVHTLELADALCERGHEVTVFAAAKPGQTLFRTTQAHLSVAPLAPHEPGLVPMVAARRDALVSHLQALPTLADFDVLHSQDGITANALATLKERRRIQGFVRTVHHLDDFLEPTLRDWQARGVRSASQVLCVSPSWQATLQHDWGVEAQVVHNGVNTRRFTRHASAEDAAMLQGLGVQGEGPVWLSVGGVEERKNTTRLLLAFAQVQAMRLAWQAPGQLVIAGGASLLDHDACGQQFKAALAAQPLDVQERVIVTGPLPDAALPALYRRATALAMPSLMEGFGLVALEALACGTPAIVSRISPFVDHFAPHEVLWAEPSSTTSIAQALNDSLNEAKRQPIVQAAPGVCARFSWAQSAARHESIYRALHSLQVLKPPGAASASAISFTETSHA